MMPAQRYKDPTARERMASSLCPECGRPEDDHGGWGSVGCSLTDNGVAQRINQYRQDMDPSTLTKGERNVLMALVRGDHFLIHDRIAKSLNEKGLAEWNLHYALLPTEDGKAVVAAIKEKR